MVEELDKRARVRGGYASVRDVETGQLEDHQHSFFLAEMYGCGFSHASGSPLGHAPSWKVFLTSLQNDPLGQA